MRKIGLEDITQADFDAAADVVSSGIKAYNRKLDVRAGTVLRDLLVDPEAAIESVTSGQIAEARKASSLKLLQEAQEGGEEIDQEDVNAILANFNITPSGGRRAKGVVKVVVADGTVAHSVPAGFVFRTIDGLEFASDNAVNAIPDSFPSSSYASDRVRLYEGAAGWFFLVPVTAVEYGAAGNIGQGTSLVPDTSMSMFVMSEAYKAFDGGSDAQSVASVMESIPSGLSIRGFVNKTAVEGMLRAEFDSGNFPVVAVSSVGYGNAAQIRDRHNLFGVAVGGRVDVYVRNFSDLFTMTAVLVGKAVPDSSSSGGEDGRYVIDVPPGVFPGACWIKSVSDPYRDGYGEDVLSSFVFDASRTADVSGTWHDFDRSNAPVEAFNSVWQGFRIALKEVTPNLNTDDSSSGNDGWSAEREFKVTAWCLPQAAELQAYVDREDVRSVSTDVVVRCPIVCSVSVNAVVRYDPKKPMDEAGAMYAIRSYINGRGFVGRLTRSEIVQVLKNLGAVSVEMPEQDMLYGELHDAFGVRHVLSGDALDVSDIEDGQAMLSPDTVVFAAEPENVQIKFVPNS